MMSRADLCLATAINQTPYVPAEFVRVAIEVKTGQDSARAFEVAKQPVPNCFRSLLSPSWIDEELCGIMCNLYQLLGVLNEYEDTAVSESFWTPLPAQLLVVGHSLCCYSAFASQPLGDFRECVRTAAMIVVHSTLLKNHPHTAMIRSLVGRLQTYLERLDLSKLWLSNAEILLWLLFVGAAGSQGEVEQPWFITSLADGALRFELYSWDEARAKVRKFLYVERMLDASWRKIWTSVEQSSSLRSSPS